MNTKIKIKSIVVTRAEGPIDLCGTWEVKTLQEANEILATSSLTVGPIGYDKHDVIIEWEDGYKWESRIDVEGIENDGAERIGEHVRSFIRFKHGLFEDSELPKHWTPQEYRRMVLERTSAADISMARTFLERYDLSDF